MNVDQALEVAHTIKRKVGVIHCGEPDCELCAARVLADEVRRQQSEIAGLRKLANAKPLPKGVAICRHCSGPTVDGICADCDT